MKITPRKDKYAAMFTIASETEADKTIIEHFLAHADGKKIHIHSSGGTSHALGHSEISFTIGLVDKGDFEAKPKPTFEAGKSYRTRGGDKATIKDIGVASPDYITGRVNDGPHDWSWFLSGHINVALVDSPMDLLPGAIEDEKAEAEPVEDREYRVDLRQIHSRINRMSERVEKLTAELTSHRVNTAAGLGQNDERVDNLTEAVQQLQADAIARNERELMNADRKAILDRIAEQPAVDSAAWTGRPAPPKRTIKGGWMNVYKRKLSDDKLNGTFVTIYDTKDEADSAAVTARIACIQIPDITEGEGL